MPVSSATRTASTRLTTTEGGSSASLSMASSRPSTRASRAAPSSIWWCNSARRSSSMPRSSAVLTFSFMIEATCCKVKPRSLSTTIRFSRESWPAS